MLVSSPCSYFSVQSAKKCKKKLHKKSIHTLSGELLVGTFLTFFSQAYKKRENLKVALILCLWALPWIFTDNTYKFMFHNPLSAREAKLTKKTTERKRTLHTISQPEKLSHLYIAELQVYILLDAYSLNNNKTWLKISLCASFSNLLTKFHFSYS